MQEENESFFYAALLHFIQANTRVKEIDEGFDANVDSHFSAYQKLLKGSLLPTSSDSSLPIEEILRHYQYLFGERGPIHIEKKLLEAFSPPKFSLKVYRGLPRIYHRHNPGMSHVKTNFAHLPSLKKLGLEKHLLRLYELNRTRIKGKICLLNWIISDGWGDWVAAREIESLIKSHFPELQVDWVALFPKRMRLPQSDAIHVAYDQECIPQSLPEDVTRMIRESDLIFSFPTFYPHTSELLKQLKKHAARNLFPRFINVGEYGFIESSWFHPKTGHRSMGLHFLEKGVLIRKSGESNFGKLSNERLLFSLFQTTIPGPLEIEQYLDSRSFYLAYLLTPIGGAIYLHALLKSREFDPKPIDICTPDLGWLIGHIERQKKEGRSLLERGFGVGEVEIEFEGRSHFIKIAETGKRLRILCPGPLLDSDFRLLVQMSSEFVAVRGNQSFSEAVSANRTFFYDGAIHARYFIKDLIALAENRIAMHRNAVSIFRNMGKSFLHSLPEEEGDWVDETYFQEKESWFEIALHIGMALQDPDAIAGCKKLNQLICTEHSFQNFLIPFIRREFMHRFSPQLSQAEQMQIDLFATGEQTISETLIAIAANLQKRGQYER